MPIALYILINSVFGTLMLMGIVICVMDLFYIGYDPDPDDYVDDDWYYREQR